MAKIGTAHIEIKPVLDTEALEALTSAIERAVAAGVERGMNGARTINIYGGDISATDPERLASLIARKNAMGRDA